MINMKLGFTLESLENLEDMFPQYYMHSDIYNRLKYYITFYCALETDDLWLKRPVTTTFLQDFLVILKRMLQNYKRILKKYVLVSDSNV